MKIETERSSSKELNKALAYLKNQFKLRLLNFFGTNIQESNEPFEIESNISLNKIFEEYKYNREEYLLFLLALAPHIQSDFLDNLISEHLPKAGDFPQLGGNRGKHFRGFLPTGETALFLLAGDHLEAQIRIQQYFDEDHFFAKKRILQLETVAEGEPRMSGKLMLSQDAIDIITTGKVKPPRFSMNFPAQLLETKMDWEDLVLNKQTLNQVQELKNFIQHGSTLLNDWGMNKRLKPGYRVLFHGPPGTGKTLTASLIGKYTQKVVYRVDLSMVISKFIGETEKNLANLFVKAENKDWILFFDEADALFGKRTNVRDAHDKYANQEVAYLLQRVESYDGLVILATNFKGNIDEAFMRRFQSVVYFPLPKAHERLKLWQQSFPQQVKLDNINLVHIAEKFELTGASIINIVQYCCLEALGKQTNTIDESSLIRAIKREYQKEGKLI